MRGWFVVLAALPAIARAQSVRGTVTERASQRPIPGAVVFLLDANQAVVARDLTNETGSYRLTAPRAGTYRVRTLRIGFRPVLSEAFDLAAQRETALPLAVESIPVNLSAVRVESRANCNVRGDATPAYNAWNEVATALNAALLSSRLRGTSATILNYDRWTEPGSDVVLRQGANVREGLPGQPWRSVSADSLHRAGFVVEGADGWYTFHALDLTVLLSDVFLQDHCLALRGVDNGQIAIEFTPSRDRDRIAEIRGFVWLDATTLELRRVQFRYVNIAHQYEQADAGGDLEFIKLRNGNWVISRWQIRMPTAFTSARPRSYRGLSSRPEVRATEVKTTGGDLLRLVFDDDTLWSLPARSFQGRVTDSLEGRPVADARVELAGTNHAASTDASGRFQFEDVLPGSYRVRVVTPDFEALAAFHETTALLVNPGASVDVRIPLASQLVARWCPAALSPAIEGAGLPGLLVGIVRQQRDSTPVPGAHVSVEWREAEVQQNFVAWRDRAIEARTDGHGVYRACGAPAAHPLKVATEFDGKLAPVGVRIDSSRVHRLDFWISDGVRQNQ